MPDTALSPEQAVNQIEIINAEAVEAQQVRSLDLRMEGRRLDLRSGHIPLPGTAPGMGAERSRADHPPDQRR